MALASLGRELASRADWWGADREAVSAERTVIEMARAGAGIWEIRVRDAVGVIVLADVQLHIRPKIPPEHFLYLARRSGRLPRTAGESGGGAAGPLWELAILWFLDAAEDLLRRGLIRDYAGIHETLSTIRGQIDVKAAARRYYTGTLLFDCSFEDHVEDTSPNRLIRAAAAYAAAGPLPDAVRRRARRLLARFDHVGELDAHDSRWQPDRRSAHYRTAVTLARHVLQARGRSLSVGGELVWTFLIRTPELIEDGIRSVLQDHFGTGVVTKAGVRLVGSSMTFNPDLRFSGTGAVADVKYKLASGDWNRGDLYQVLAFAVSLRCFDAAIFNFVADEQSPLSLSLAVGDHRVKQISWPVHALDPGVAASTFVQYVREWLDSQ